MPIWKWLAVYPSQSQTTPTSSEWLQSLLPQDSCSQSKKDFSSPWHPTPSNQIGPDPGPKSWDTLVWPPLWPSMRHTTMAILLSLWSPETLAASLQTVPIVHCEELPIVQRWDWSCHPWPWDELKCDLGKSLEHMGKQSSFRCETLEYTMTYWQWCQLSGSCETTTFTKH